MPTEAELEQLFVRVSELEAWRKVQQGEVKKEVPKEPLVAKPAVPFPPIPPNPPTPPKNETNATSSGQSSTSKK